MGYLPEKGAFGCRRHRSRLDTGTVGVDPVPRSRLELQFGFDLGKINLLTVNLTEQNEDEELGTVRCQDGVWGKVSGDPSDGVPFGFYRCRRPN